ncbi:lipopolysaccharide biosynthesis protein [Frankia sp. CNm7]|uniref:lipopolysaccharide biosynthesis protein n=1 Tax=Frankia nepalensis TaxID=1836974 RepID=UPI001931D484|nr:lipopolysaccharide biosynthesis protein [Frankia nepalensis]MBL7519570.1 lipopolysaccharide biosynthesis protein [Frankia nepalensis]
MTAGGRGRGWASEDRRDAELAGLELVGDRPAPGPAAAWDPDAATMPHRLTPPAGGGDAEGDGLGRSVRRGLGFSLLNNAVSRVGTVVTGIVLARLLIPEDYGEFAVALVVLNALLSVNELGVSLAVVRWPTDPRMIARTVTTLALAGSGLLFAGTLLAAPAIAEQLGAPEAVRVIRLLAVSVFIDGLASVPAALLTRQFLQGRRMVADLTGLLANTGVTVGLAATGHGVYSLAFGYLAGNAVTAVLITAAAPYRVWPGFDRPAARQLIAFGLPLAGSSLLVFGVLNIDTMIVGSRLGAVELGFYTLAFNLSSWPVNMFSLAVRRVAMPAFARLSADQRRLQESFARSLGLLLAVALPSCALLAALATPVIRIVYGDRWAAAADALRWLAVLGAGRIAAELAYDLLVAAGRTRAVFAVQGAWLAALVPGLYLGAHLGGIGGVAAAHAAVALLVVGPALLAAISGAGLAPLASLRHCVRPLVAAAVAVAVAGFGQRWVHGDLAQLFGLSTAAGAAALLVLAPFLLSFRRRGAAPDGPAANAATG